MTKDRSKRRPRTAAALMAELLASPEYVAGLHEQARQRDENLRRYKRATAPMFEELAATGLDVASLSELRASRSQCLAAAEVLLKWLPRMPESRIKADIVHTLSYAGPTVAPALIAGFKTSDASDTQFRWSLGNALADTANDAVFDEIVELVRDRANGRAREMLALSLAKMKKPEAIAVLTKLLDDEEVVGHAVMALGKLRAHEARPRIEALTQHPKSWVRKEVKKALARIDRKPPR